MRPRIDAPGRGVYPHHAARRLLPALPVVLLLGACAARARPAGPVPATPPRASSSTAAATTPSPQELARAAVDATARRVPMRVVFDWKVQDRDARFSGQGVARVEPPDRARLDLFGPRGEGYLSAAVVGDSLRVPPGLRPQAAAVPPQTLLWSVLGVLRPPEGARLVSARQQGTEVRLEYARGDERWQFVVAAGRLQRAELDRPGTGRQTLELQGEGPLGLPREAVFRDFAAFRQLTLTLDRADEAQPFPPDTWAPGRL
jgi:hypothetical protein